MGTVRAGHPGGGVIRDTPLGAALVVALFAAGVSGSSSAAPVDGTFSIVGYDSTTGELGVAVASRAIAGGNFGPWALAGVGAIAAQGNGNPSWGVLGIQMLGEGISVSRMVDSLWRADPAGMSCQIGALDRRGVPGGFTGNRTLFWSGGLLDWCLAAQGTGLTSHEVVDAMADSFRVNQGVTLAERLLGSLVAGEARGGAASGGLRSAALLVVRPSRRHPEFNARYISLRLDDREAPIAELVRLYRAYEGERLIEERLEFADEFEGAGKKTDRELELGSVRALVARVLADSTATAAELNATAWAIGSRGLWLPQAAALAQRATALEPANPAYLDTEAEIRLRLKRPSEALEIERKALALAPGDEFLAARVAEFEKALKDAQASGGAKKGGGKKKR